MKDIKYKLLYGVMKTIALMPLGVLYVLSDFMYFLMYYVIHYRRVVVRTNLKYSFPDYSEEQLRKIEKDFYHHLADCFAETIKLLHISDEEIDRRVNVKNGDFVDEMAKDGKSFMLMVGHFGNWEWVTAANRHFHIDYSGQVYRPLRSDSFDKLMLKIRSRFGTECIPQTKVIRKLVALSKTRQFIVGFVADQRPNNENVDHYVHFLNQKTRCSVGAEYLAKKLDTHFIFIEVHKPKRGYYEMEFKKITPSDMSSDFPYTDEYMRMLEENIKKSPHLWLWSHNRWSRNYK